MCVVTFGVYEIYWFYQQWRHVQRRGERVHPALRTLFAGLFCYALFRRVSEDATQRGIARAPSAIGCAVAFIALAITVRLPDPWSTLSLLQLLPLALVQRAASAAALAAVPGADPNTRLTPINWVGIAFGVMILLLTALAATLPPPAPAKPAPTATTQAALTPDAGRTTQAGRSIRPPRPSGERELKPRHRRRREAVHEHAVLHRGDRRVLDPDRVRVARTCCGRGCPAR